MPIKNTESFNSNALKMHQTLNHWYENEPSGNPGLEQGCQIFLGPNIYQSGIFGMKINHLATLGRRRGKSTYCKNAFGGAPSS
jgi:hypothetical protein